MHVCADVMLSLIFIIFEMVQTIFEQQQNETTLHNAQSLTQEANTHMSYQWHSLEPQT